MDLREAGDPGRAPPDPGRLPAALWRRKEEEAVEGLRMLDGRVRVGGFLHSLARSPERVLMLDYDGTLAPFCVDPAQAQPWPGVLQSLDAIAAAPGTRMVVVSGRPAEALLPLLRLERRPEIWGAHGWERLHPDGSLQVRVLAATARSALEEAAAISGPAQAMGARLEKKSASLALHWRGLEEGAAREIEQWALQAWRPLTRDKDLELLPFDGGLELRPRQCDKGQVVATVMEEAAAGIPFAYLGDDMTDEDAFAAVKARPGGLAVLVRERLRRTAADAWIRPPRRAAGVSRLLAAPGLITPSRGMRMDMSEGLRGTRQRLVVVSNRLPLVFQRDGEDRWEATPSSGGLVSALMPVLRNRGGTWLGWPGTTEVGEELEQTLKSASDKSGYQLCAVQLDQEEVHDFYNGFSNEIIWPLFHDLQSLCNFQPRYWRTYCEVNRKFAQAILCDQQGAGDFIWVHDYHLMNVAHELRCQGCASRLGFFLHIPFPPVDLFVKLPWRAELIRALLQFDLLGFQTLRDRRNFVQCARALVPDLKVHGKGQVVMASRDGHDTRIGAFPIGIDYDFYARAAAAPRVAARARELHELLPERSLVLGIDRLDYTKGVPQRLEAFETLLRGHPELHGKLSLIQVIVPSRVDIPSYAELKTTIEQMVGRINGEYMRPGGWVPVWYVYGSLNRTELMAHYRAADIALITPLKDGMNLVAKEYCAASIEENCVLILSEFAGSAAQLRRGALLVNPYDIEGMAQALLRAHQMGMEERRARMHRLRRSVRDSDVYRWVDSFMHAAFTRQLEDFPLPAGQAAGQDEGELPL